MSANEIITELPKLERKDLELVEARLRELLDQGCAQAKESSKAIGEVLLEFAGQAQGLPPDYSTNLDHYLHGVPKRQV
jgi:hypothetical protein